MSARYLLDTNICIYIRQKRPPAVLKRFEQTRVGEVVISIITFGELIYGAQKSEYKKIAFEKLAALTEFLPVESLPQNCAQAYGTIRADLEARGAVIGNNDLWIAAHAVACGLTLVTNNENEFRRIHGLRVENWTR